VPIRNLDDDLPDFRMPEPLTPSPPKPVEESKDFSASESDDEVEVIPKRPGKTPQEILWEKNNQLKARIAKAKEAKTIPAPVVHIESDEEEIEEAKPSGVDDILGQIQSACQ
jgi:hypothetical protein